MWQIISISNRLTSFYTVNNVVKTFCVKELADNIRSKRLARAGVVLEGAIVGDSGDEETSARDTTVDTKSIINLL